MKGKILLLIFLVFLVSISAQSNIPQNQNLVNDRLDGDSPLTPFFNWSGNGEVNVFTSVLGGVENPADNITIENIPAGATIIQAYFCVTSWQADESESSAVFAGSNLPSIPATFIDPDGSLYFLSYYRWDVTDFITGNGNYYYSTANIHQCYLSFLIVLFEESSLPYATVMINEGAESLQFAASTTFFDFPVTEENGDLLVLTQASDPSDGPEEYIAFNGTTLLGPADIFNANLGNYADMHLLSNINILEGENSMTINTGADWFGIHYAVLSSGEINIEVNDYEMDNTTFNLKQNYPNPFTTNTTISFSRLKDSENTYIVIYNIKGQQVKKYSIFNNQSSISWDGKDENGNTVIPGLYFYKLSNGKESQTKKMILIRK